MFKIFGKNCVNEAIRAKHFIFEVDIEESANKKNPNFKKMLDDKNIKNSILSRKEMDKKFYGKHQGFGAIVKEYQYSDIETLIKKSNKRKVFLALDGIEDPHNLGAIIRSCDAFSIDGIIIPKNRSVSINETVAHVSTGAIEYVPICMVNNLANTLNNLKKRNFWIVGTDASASSLADDIDKTLNVIVVIGSEGFGISKTVKNICDYYVKIPMTGHVNSLNASVSCAIILSDII